MKFCKSPIPLNTKTNESYIFFNRLLDSMKMPGQRPGFQISDILGLNEGKGLEPAPAQALGCSLELPHYPPAQHYPHDLLRHHQPWLSLDHHEGNGNYLTNFLLTYLLIKFFIYYVREKNVINMFFFLLGQLHFKRVSFSA